MFRKLLINSAFKLIKEKLVNRINHDQLRYYVGKLLLPLEDVADKLTDKNPDDAAQMKEVWEKYKDEFETDSLELAIDIVEKKVTDETIRNLVISALRTFLEENSRPHAQPSVAVK